MGQLIRLEEQITKHRSEPEHDIFNFSDIKLLLTDENEEATK